MPSVSVKDVSQQDFTVALAAHFKKSGKMKIPEWVDLIKTLLSPLDLRLVSVILLLLWILLLRRTSFFR